MKLWLVSRTDQCDYDEHDSFVVVAPDEETARRTIPGGSTRRWGEACIEYLCRHYGETEEKWRHDRYPGWAKTLGNVVAECVGEALPEAVSGTVICASFNAG